MAWKHGPYGNQNTAGSKQTTKAGVGAVVFGTAPVHTIEDGANHVNVPILVRDYEEAVSYFGYSDDWAGFSLCEVMHYVLEEKGVGPLILINSFDPATHKESTGGTKSLTPVNGVVTIADAALIVLDSVVVKTSGEEPETKEKGVDYAISYSYARKTITIVELSSGTLGNAALTITYDIAKPSAVTNAQFIGATDNSGMNTGIYAIRNVFQLTGMVPSFMAAPGWSEIPEIHEAMYENSLKVNGHWDVFMMTDIPIVDSESTAITLNSAYTWKNANGYNKPNEKPSFPMVEGTDGNKYHLSTLRLGAMMELLGKYDGVPYHSDSNQPIPIARNLWLGASAAGRVYDDTLINDKLCKNGISSAAYVGYWATWGACAGDYDQENANLVNVAETNMMMLFFITNDFQLRHFKDTDQPKSPNDVQSMAQDEQTLLDRRVGAGQLTYGKVWIKADAIARSDMYNGDYTFSFGVSTTPLMKSLTADVFWTDKGYQVFFAALDAE